MDFKVSERTKIKLTIPSLGKTYELSKPTFADQEAYEDELREASEKNTSSIKPMIKFLASTGIPEADARKLDSEEYTQVIQFIMGAKKN